MRRDVTAVILAGGFGTRIRHLLENIPKPMVPVSGRPFIEWVVRYFRAQGVRHFVLSTGYRADVIKRHFDTQPVPDTEVVCIPEMDPLGTAGGFLNAAFVSGSRSSIWLVANGDSLALADIGGLLNAIKPISVSAAILGIVVPDSSRFGTLEVSASGGLIRFAEKRRGAGLINAGVYAFKEQSLSAFSDSRPLSFEVQVFPSLLAAKAKIAVHTVEAPFLDIGTPDTLTEATRFIQTNLRYLSSIL